MSSATSWTTGRPGSASLCAVSWGWSVSSRAVLTDQDLYLFNEGSHFGLGDKLGAHLRDDGCDFAVWAPNAESVSVVADFNGWDPRSNELQPCGGSGIWQGFIAGVGQGAVYKYHVVARGGGYRVDKADPFAVLAEVPPKTG